MKRILTTIALILGLSGCGAAPLNHDPVIHFHVDKDAKPATRECLQFSADKWREQTSGIADVSFEYDYNKHDPKEALAIKAYDRVVMWQSTTEEVVEYEREMSEDGAWKLMGQASGKVTNTIRMPIEVRLVEDRLGDPNLCRLTVIHEFGHAFGIPHLGKNTDIMFPSVDTRRTVCLKRDDLMAFAFLHQVPFEHMKPCPNQDDLPNPVE